MLSGFFMYSLEKVPVRKQIQLEQILHFLQMTSKTKFRTYKKRDLRARQKYWTNCNIQLMENLRHLKVIQNINTLCSI